MIITRGKNGSTIYTNGDIINVGVFPAKSIKDPTGGGDAFRAGLLCGIMKGLPLAVAAQMGSLCATYVLEHVGTQSHRFTVAEFIERYRTHFDDDGLLDQIMP